MTEVQIHSRLSHPNISEFYECRTTVHPQQNGIVLDSTYSYSAMEFWTGGSLFDLLTYNRGEVTEDGSSVRYSNYMSEDTARYIFLQIVSESIKAVSSQIYFFGVNLI
jgi:serine/threonine protein kinase